MNIINKINLISAPILVAVLLLPIGFSSAARGQSFTQLGLVDPIVGAYTLLISSECSLSQPITQSSCAGNPKNEHGVPCCPLTPGNEVLSADGTSSGHDNGAIGGPGIFGKVGLATAHTGIWKYIGKVKGLRTYTWILFNGVNYMEPVAGPSPDALCLPPPALETTACAEFFTPALTNYGSSPQVPYLPVGWLPVVITATLQPNGNLALDPASAYFVDNNHPAFDVRQPLAAGSATAYRIDFGIFGK